MLLINNLKPNVNLNGFLVNCYFLVYNKIKIKCIINILNSTFTWRKCLISLKKLLNNEKTQVFQNNCWLRIKGRQIRKIILSVYALNGHNLWLHFFLPQKFLKNRLFIISIFHHISKLATNTKMTLLHTSIWGI